MDPLRAQILAGTDPLLGAKAWGADRNTVASKPTNATSTKKAGAAVEEEETLAVLSEAEAHLVASQIMRDFDPYNLSATDSLGNAHSPPRCSHAVWRPCALPSLNPTTTSINCVGRTVLHYAAEVGHTRLLEWLLRNAGALINERDSGGHTALSLLCKYRVSYQFKSNQRITQPHHANVHVTRLLDTQAAARSHRTPRSTTGSYK